MAKKKKRKPSPFGTSTYTMACSKGFCFIDSSLSAIGCAHPQHEHVLMGRFSNNPERSGSGLWVGYDDKAGKYHFLGDEEMGYVNKVY